MNARETYEADLREHLQLCRKEAGIPSRDSLSSQEEAICQVLGGHLIRWLSDWGPQLLQERAFLARLQGWDEEPLICFQSDLPGLVAADEILEDKEVPVVWGLPSDFRSFPNTDADFTHHIELHSRFIPFSQQVLRQKGLQVHPPSSGEVYLVHLDESVLGPLFARGAHHLWKWTGSNLVLLEEAFETWVS